ncbi:MAG: hypothetical protein WC824_04280, partial [Bacteroidota bacterium]
MGIKKIIRHALLILWTLSTCVSLASAQLTVAVQMDPNPSPYISDWRSNPNTIRLIITNTSNQTLDIRVDGYIQGDKRGRVVETKLDAAVPPVSVMPGTTILNAVDAHVIDDGVVRFIGSTRTETVMSGRLPEDRYQLCIRLVSFDAPHAALSQEMCAYFQILLVQPPELIFPLDASATGTPPSFQWSMVSTGTRSLARYELTLMEMDPGQNNVASAFQTNAPLLVRETTIPMYPFSPSDPPLQPGRRYAWSVRAFDNEDRLTFANGGKSLIWTFTYGSKPMTAEITSKEPINTIGRVKVDVSDLFLPDTLIAGTFKIIVESWDKKSSAAASTLPSGIGYVRFSCGSGNYSRMRSKRANMIAPTIEQTTAGKQTQTTAKKADTSKAWSTIETVVKHGLENLAAPEATGESGKGIRVSFKDVHWQGSAQTSVVLDQGVATYPTEPASPPVPATIAIDSGFILAIESLVITPVDATVTGAILLPSSIISAENCTHASIGLPQSKITSHCDLYQVVPDSAFGPWYIGETDILVEGKGYIIDFSA